MSHPLRLKPPARLTFNKKPCLVLAENMKHPATHTSLMEYWSACTAAYRAPEEDINVRKEAILHA
jgi:hypothetical protein